MLRPGIARQDPFHRAHVLCDAVQVAFKLAQLLRQKAHVLTHLRQDNATVVRVSVRAKTAGWSSEERFAIRAGEELIAVAQGRLQLLGGTALHGGRERGRMASVLLSFLHCKDRTIDNRITLT